MDNTKEGWLVNRPFVLDGTNYDYRKVKMIAFLKSMYKKKWKAIVKGWKHLVFTSYDETSILNLEAECYNVEDEEAIGYSKSLSVIFNGVDKNMFRLINTCTEAK